MFNTLMIRYVIILSSLLFLIPALSFSQYKVSDDRLRGMVSQYGQAVVVVTLPDLRMIDNLTQNVSILNVSGHLVEISLSRLTVEWFIRQKFSYIIKERQVPRELTSAGSVEKALSFDVYPTHAQYDSIMQSFMLNYPLLCRLDTIGTSIRGQLVLALQITGPDHSVTRPEVFYTSSMHGDETGGFIMMLRLSDYLLKNYYSDDRVRELMDNLSIYINPLANPDGTYNNSNTISSPVRYNANGVDLNRNFPDETVAPVVPEKENADMIRFMRKHRFVISANFHSGVEVVNYPWDRWLNILHSDDSWFYSVSRAYADTVHVYSGPGYMNFLNNGITRGALWYVVHGGRQDFVTQDLHGREVTIELDNDYITPVSQLASLWEYNRRSLLGYIENALYGIHGTVKDSATLAPVPAEVFIKNHDFDSSQVYADTLTGSFVRMLSPGIWPLTFTAEGYRDSTLQVTVYDGQRTDINLLMKKGYNGPDTTLPKPPALYPNPASTVIKALLPEEVVGMVKVRISDQSGRIVIGYDAEAVKDEPLLIDISSLSPGSYVADFRNSKKVKSCRGRFMVIK
jgi:hypothetical protein